MTPVCKSGRISETKVSSCLLCRFHGLLRLDERGDRSRGETITIVFIPLPSTGCKTLEAGNSMLTEKKKPGTELAPTGPGWRVTHRINA